MSVREWLGIKSVESDMSKEESDLVD